VKAAADDRPIGAKLAETLDRSIMLDLVGDDQLAVL
jgi:hypothetical protein